MLDLGGVRVDLHDRGPVDLELSSSVDQSAKALNEFVDEPLRSPHLLLFGLHAPASQRLVHRGEKLDRTMLVQPPLEIEDPRRRPIGQAPTDPLVEQAIDGHAADVHGGILAAGERFASGPNRRLWYG